MSPPTAAGPSRTACRLMSVAALTAALLATGAVLPAHADGPGDSGGTPAPPVKVDERDPDLKIPEGGTLAEPKVLDIKTVVEDLGGEERREDTNADVTFALQAEVLFGKDSAKLSSDALARIGTIADEIDDQDAKDVKVFGFTDNLGSSDHGDVLSRKRAESVRKALEKELPGDVSFEVKGYGEQFPIADNSSEEGRRKNRRVEIEFPKNE